MNQRSKKKTGDINLLAKSIVEKATEKDLSGLTDTSMNKGKKKPSKRLQRKSKNA